VPLIRKPGIAVAAAAPDASRVLQDLASADADERWTAARAAAAVPGSERTLGEALSVEQDVRVRQAMLTSLAQIGTPASAAPLLSMLKSEKAASRTQALDAIRVSALLPQLVKQLLQDPDADVRLLSCDLVRSLPAGQANDLLAPLLEHEVQSNVCAAAVEVLAEVGEPSVLSALAACERRFKGNEFLAFAIKTVVERIRAAHASSRG
jgi:HEAT repeat protein